MNMAVYNLVIDYVSICTKTLDKDHFEKIISKHVELTHQTNEETVVEVKGREQVSDLFNRCIFSNTSDIHVQKRNLLPNDDKITLTLVVTENKKEEEKVSRYVFEEVSIFEFKNKQNNPKISKIETRVKRIPI